MANHFFEGEVDVLSEKQINLVCEVLEKHGFEKCKVVISSLGKAGDNFSSNVKLVTAERDGKSFQMIAKVAPTSEFLRTAINAEAAFGNELIMYNRVLPKFRQLEDEAGIPEENRLKFPICYGALDETLQEIILLEDVRERDYVMKDRFIPLTNEEIRIVLNTFAKLHSFSFILKHKDPATYKEITSRFIDFFTSSQMEENAKTSFPFLEENISSLFDDNKYKDRIKGSLTNISREARKIRECDEGSKYSVIVHGDSWTNNILFEVDNTDAVVKDCMLIDYQLSTERCPVSDIMYLIFSCTDFDTRSKHYHDWIDEYHERLDKHLSYYGIKANCVYSKEKMLADLKRYSKFFLGWSMMIANVLSMGTEEAARFKDAVDSTDNVEEIVENMKSDGLDSTTQALMKTRIQGIIDSYYELGYCS